MRSLLGSLAVVTLALGCSSEGRFGKRDYPDCVGLVRLNFKDAAGKVHTPTARRCSAVAGGEFLKLQVELFESARVAPGENFSGTLHVYATTGGDQSATLETTPLNQPPSNGKSAVHFSRSKPEGLFVGTGVLSLHTVRGDPGRFELGANFSSMKLGAAANPNAADQVLPMEGDLTMSKTLATGSSAPDCSACDSLSADCSSADSQAPCYCAAACLCACNGEDGCNGPNSELAAKLGATCRFTTKPR